MALALACLATLPAAASGSVAKFVVKDSCNGDLACSKFNGGMPLPIVTYLAASGEANRVAVARSGDPSRSPTPARRSLPRRVPAVERTRSRAGDPRARSGPGFDAQLGDGDDSLAVAGSLGVAATLDGGDGNDTLTGGADDDTLAGGLGADRLDGGAGENILSFSARSDGVTVDLASGRSSDGDSFTRLETVHGGAGADRLLGGPRRTSSAAGRAPTSCAARAATTR